MGLRRRKAGGSSRPEAHAGFDRVAGALDGAQRSLLLAIPTARHPGAPLLEALDAFDRGLAEVERLMPGWRSDGTEPLWVRCDAALIEARAAAAHVRASPPGPTEFEALNGRIGDVLAPLEVFADAERSLRSKAT